MVGHEGDRLSAIEIAAAPRQTGWVLAIVHYLPVVATFWV